MKIDSIVAIGDVFFTNVSGYASVTHCYVSSSAQFHKIQGVVTINFRAFNFHIHRFTVDYVDINDARRRGYTAYTLRLYRARLAKRL